MRNRTESQRSWDLGIAAIGNDLSAVSDSDKQKALDLFRRATLGDTGMCDAWLAIFALGDTGREVSLALFDSLDRFGEEFARAGKNPSLLRTRFDIDHLVSHSLYNTRDAILLESVQRTREKRHEDALDLLPPLSSAATSLQYGIGAVYANASLPDEAIEAFTAVTHGSDAALTSAANHSIGYALALKGKPHEAAAWLDKELTCTYSAIRQNSLYSRGLVSRIQGKPDEGLAHLQAAYDDIVLDGKSGTPIANLVAAAIADPLYNFYAMTPESIASRTNKWDATTATIRALQGQPTPVAAPTPAATPTPGPQTPNTTELDDAARRELLAATLAELDAQIGMPDVKEQVRSILAQVQTNRLRAARGLSVSTRPRHLVFQGPPGTGKTTIARLIARIYYAAGVLTTANVVEASRADFIGQHLGHSAIKSDATIDKALNGVLFIDEAYALNDGGGIVGGDAFGREAVSVLLARMENDRDRLVVIIAGYKPEIDGFLASNPGLDSRFATRVSFDSFSPVELGQIAALVGTQIHAPLTDEAQNVFETRSSELTSKLLDRLGNARFARECVYSAAEMRDLRLVTEHGDSMESLTDDELTRITAADIEAALDDRLENL